MIVRKRSCPAVSHWSGQPMQAAVGRTICSFIRLPSSSIVLILKSMPMVVMNEGVHASSQKRNSRHDLPTPESPISSSLMTEAASALLCGYLTATASSR